MSCHLGQVTTEALFYVLFVRIKLSEPDIYLPFSNVAVDHWCLSLSPRSVLFPFEITSQLHHQWWRLNYLAERN